MAIIDQYGNIIPSTRRSIPYDLTDPMVKAAWSRALTDEAQRPGMFDGPRLVDASGRPMTGPFRGARQDQFLGIILNGKLVGAEE
jgi:hypothetical protein